MSFKKARVMSGLVSASVAAAVAVPVQAAVLNAVQNNVEVETGDLDQLMLQNTVSQARRALAGELYTSQFKALAASQRELAVAAPTVYLNIHSDASLGSEVLGKLYSNDIVKVLADDDGKWTKVSSGSIVGYVMSDYLVEDGSAQVLADLVKTDVAQVQDDDVRIYKSADDGSDTVTTVSKGDKLTVKDTDENSGYIKVSTRDGDGYIARSDAEVVSVYPTAVTEEEDQKNTSDSSAAELADQAQDRADSADKIAQKAKEEAEEAKKEADEASANAQKLAATSTDTSKKNESRSLVSSTSSEQTAASADAQKAQLTAQSAQEKAKIVQTAADSAQKSADNLQAAADVAKEKAKKDTVAMGQAVVDFATQYVGNPYVWGGTSLEHGIDCSGFTMKVYEHFGVSLPHYDMSQRKYGSSVASLDDAQPGDLVFYSGHVAIYMGDGKIVHAANRRDGIKISNANYQSIACIRRIFN